MSALLKMGDRKRALLSVGACFAAVVLMSACLVVWGCNGSNTGNIVPAEPTPLNDDEESDTPDKQADEQSADPQSSDDQTGEEQGTDGQSDAEQDGENSPTDKDATDQQNDEADNREDKQGDSSSNDTFHVIEMTVVKLHDGVYSYDNLTADLATLYANYPLQFSYESYGKSLDGRELWVAYLGNKSASAQVIITAGMHGCEYVNCYTTMLQLEHYLENYETATYKGHTYSELLQDVCIVVVPMCNPDGSDLAQLGLASLRNDEYRTWIAQLCASAGITDTDAFLKAWWKTNARGVDINRNFDALWETWDEGVYWPNASRFKGYSADSEPETQALIALTDSLSNPVASVCMHLQGKVLYWRCHQTGELEQANRRLVDITRDITGYYIIEEEQDESSYSNWTIVARDIPTITIENAVSSYPLSYNLSNEIFANNLELWAAYALEYGQK